MTDASGFGPHLFREDAISEETRAFNHQIEQLMRDMPALSSRPPQVTRDEREAGASVFGPLHLSPMAVERSVPGRAGAVPVRVFVPESVVGVYIHIHGGGWTLGRAHHQDARLEQMAGDCNVAVVSVDYRLAPEHPYPAGPDDCEDVAVWLVENAKREFGSERIVIGGGSAGGHLSAVTLLRLRDRHGYRGFAGANLVYGCYDLTLTPSARRWGDRRLVMTTSDIHWFFDQFVPAERRSDPDVSPLYADLHSMPPALFTVGTLDSILDDSLFMYTRWVAAGNRAELAVYPGGAHGFDNFPITIAREANARMDAFIRACVEA
ncbi:MAG: hypothetical protein DCC58_06690 [Chloroflexi bacterium]|nr:MAG: hypothetical protein DCC58_06690 [Chloroflexota bacterium]